MSRSARNRAAARSTGTPRGTVNRPSQPVSRNLAARVTPSSPAVGAVRRTTCAKISTGQRHWDRPATLPFSTGVIAHDMRWSL